MELHPFFEHSFTSPRKNLWYVLATEGDAPSMRVGASATFMPGKTDDDEGKLFFVGGANPAGTFSEVNVLDLSTMQWDRLDTPSRISRYEHAVSTYRPHDSDEPAPSSIIVFGGAVQSGNLNDVQEFSSSDERWVPVRVDGTPPSKRTQHSMSAFFSDGRLLVFGGGMAGAEPVDDTSVYSFDPASSTWTALQAAGTAPKPRHGHLLVASEAGAGHPERLFVHGGMAGSEIFDDLFCLEVSDPSTGAWRSLEGTGPCARAAHGGVILKEHLFVFGGLGKHGALDDMWSYDIAAGQWSEVQFSGPPPASRLDFASCLLSIRTRADANVDDGTCDDSNDVAGSQQEQHATKFQRSVFFLVHGGMDTEGTIFDDTLLFLLHSEALP